MPLLLLLALAALAAERPAIVYLDGGPGSRLEESADLVPELARRGYTVVAFDPPNEGYSSRVDPTMIAPEDVQTLGALSFADAFTADFVEALDRVIPVKKRGIAVIGGSLGGCLSLRLGRRSDLPWLRRVAAWNPACVWPSFRETWLKRLALRAALARARESEAPGRRAEYFEQAYGPGAPWYLGKTQPNPEEWYRGGRGRYPDWACKRDAIALSRLAQEEVYGSEFRRWHWRLGADLLAFSFLSSPESIAAPTLLVAADDDDWDEGPLRPWENRWTNTNRLARLMRRAPGRAEFLLNTGHSIHNERPALLAEAIDRFLSEPAPGPPLVLTPPVSPAADEPCSEPLSSVPKPPPELLDPADASTLRLAAPLRAAAAAKDPLADLAEAAARFEKGDDVWGRAFADLAVSGRGSYERFRELHPRASTASARRALRRAESVSMALREPEPGRRAALRKGLGWIAVSGEDDPPDRPVNVPSAPFRQFDLTVRSGGRTYRIRTLVAGPPAF